MSQGDGGLDPAPAWSLDPIVAALRASRKEHGDEPLQGKELPSREVVVRVIDGLRAALFPAHFGAAELTDSSLDYFVGHTLDVALRALQEQVRKSLRFSKEYACAESSSVERCATEISREFARRIPRVHSLLESDLRAVYKGDPAAKSLDEVLFCYPGMTAIMHHRLAHELYALGVPLLARIVSELAHSTTGIDIHPGARIGGSFFIDHGTGVVIGETTIIGERVRLYQGVTLGAKNFPTDGSGALVKGLDRHPIIEDDVVIYAGATILGRVTIGTGSSIGGNVWLTRSVPARSVITQAVAKTELFDNGAGI